MAQKLPARNVVVGSGEQCRTVRVSNQRTLRAIAAAVSEPKITYRESGAPTFNVKVYLDGRYTGSIVRNGTYWHYQPKGRGNPPGESLYSVEAVKRSLEK